MELWLAVFLGPLVAVGLGTGLVRGASLLSRLDTRSFGHIVRGFEALAVVVVGGIALLLVAGFVAFWQLSPLVALAALLVLLLAASRAWAAWREDQAERERVEE